MLNVLAKTVLLKNNIFIQDKIFASSQVLHQCNEILRSATSKAAATFNAMQKLPSGIQNKYQSLIFISNKIIAKI